MYKLIYDGNLNCEEKHTMLSIIDNNSDFDYIILPLDFVEGFITNINKRVPTKIDVELRIDAYCNPNAKSNQIILGKYGKF